MIAAVLTILLFPIKLFLSSLVAKTNDPNSTFLDRLEKNFTKGAGKTLKSAGQNVAKGTGSISKTALNLLIRAIKLLIFIIKAVIAVICSLEIVVIIIVIIIIVAIIAGAAAAILFVLDSNGGTTISSSSSSSASTDDTSSTVNASAWLQAVEKSCESFTDYANANDTKYSSSSQVTIQVDGQDKEVYLCCTGMVQNALDILGASYSGLGQSANWKSGSISGFELIAVKGNISSASDLRAGDIMVSDGHIQVATSVSGDTVTFRSWGTATAYETKGEYSHGFTWADDGSYFYYEYDKDNHYDYIYRLKASSTVTASGDWHLEWFQGSSPWNTHAWLDGGGKASNIAEGGCGCLATAVVAAHFGGDTDYNPTTCADEYYNKGLQPNRSTDAITTYFNTWHTELGKTATYYYSTTVDLDALDSCLANGGVMIADYGADVTYNGAYVWTSYGHYVAIIAGNQTDGYKVYDSNSAHSTGTSGVADWIPYSEHTFEKEYIQKCKYYYLIQ
jgi:hypothetical protein